MLSKLPKCQPIGLNQLQANWLTNSLLTVSEAWLPGWQVIVDNRKQLTIRVVDIHELLLEAGTQLVQLRYYPIMWAISWLLSLLASVTLIIWGLFENGVLLSAHQPRQRS